MATAITPLANITLGSSAATITFSSITGIYRDLFLVVNWDMTSSGQVLQLRFNGDSGANYSQVAISGNGSTSNSQPYSGNQLFLLYNNSPATGNRSTVQTHIMDYSSTNKHKNVLNRFNSPTVVLEAISGRWASSAAITSAVLSLTAGSFTAGSSFALYGVSA